MLGQRLKDLRLERHETQQQVATFLGITRPAYTAYETGKRQPDYETLIRIADHYDTSTDYLLGRTAVRSRSDDPALEPQAAHKREGLTEAENKQIDDFIKFINSQKDDSDEK